MYNRVCVYNNNNTLKKIRTNLKGNKIRYGQLRATVHLRSHDAILDAAQDRTIYAHWAYQRVAIRK